VRRREFITLFGGAAAWPIAARAQQPMPVVGFLVTASAEGYGTRVAAVRQGMADAGYIDGRNVTIEYRYADAHYDRLPTLAADLVRRHVAVIFATGSVVSPLAAKAATATIPIVFAIGSDPVKYGLVASFARPGGNVTGMSFYNAELGPKRLELLREVVPKASLFAVLVNPHNANADSDANDIAAAGRKIGIQTVVVGAGSEDELDPAFSTIAQRQADGIVLVNDALFQSDLVIPKLAALALQHRLPTIFGSLRSYVAAGMLMSYGTNAFDVYRQAGGYVGRILKGEKPADLPVQAPTKFELVINLKTAKALGLEIPPMLLGRADEVIE
jgi:putative tryptophan/tyrosine transport system substrate-binding protein